MTIHLKIEYRMNEISDATAVIILGQFSVT